MKKSLIVFATALLSVMGCSRPAKPAVSLVQTLDQWHRDAATANFTAYFDAIADDGVFLGTDPGERWRKSEFAAFSKPFFDRGKAWDFTPFKRSIAYNGPDSTLAWFDESLKTWMGVCRGSGVAVLNDAGQWKIKQYNLTVTIHNDLIGEFLEVAKKDTLNNGFLLAATAK